MPDCILFVLVRTMEGLSAACKEKTVLQFSLRISTHSVVTEVLLRKSMLDSF